MDELNTKISRGIFKAKGGNDYCLEEPKCKELFNGKMVDYKQKKNPFKIPRVDV